MAYFETSAKTGFGINEGFDYIANEAYDKICFRRDYPRNIILDEDENNSGCLEKRRKRRNVFFPKVNYIIYYWIFSQKKV